MTSFYIRTCVQRSWTLNYDGQSNENRTPARKWQWNLFYSKVISRCVNTFIPLGDETINSSFVRRWLIHYLTHTCTSSSEWNRRPRMSFFRSPKMWKSQGERSWLHGKCSSVFLPNFWSLSLTRLEYGDARCHEKRWFRPTAFQGALTLWRVAASPATNKRTTPLCSSLLASISNAGRTHFTLRSPPEQ